MLKLNNDKKAEETTLDNEPTVEVLKEVKKEEVDYKAKYYYVAAEMEFASLWSGR